MTDRSEAARKAATTRKANREAAAEAVAEKPVAKSAAPGWKELRGEALAEHLLAHQTLPDGVWADIREAEGLPLHRRPKESRSDFIRRALEVAV